MKENLTQHEKDLLRQGKQLLRILSGNVSVATTPRDKIVSLYQRYAELYARAGDVHSAHECRDRVAAFQDPEYYIAIVEGLLRDKQWEVTLSKRELIMAYYNLMEACIESEDMEKAASCKYKLDDLLMEENENE